MTPTELKFNHEQNDPESYFFTRNTMKFFGDTMANFGCYDGGDFWVLYRKRAVKHDIIGLGWHFDKETFKVSRTVAH